MTVERRMRRLGLLVAAVMLLGALGVGPAAGSAGEKAGEFEPRSSTSLGTAGLLLSGSNGLPESRLHRDVETRNAPSGSRLDGVARPAGVLRTSGGWVAAIAGVLERAGHPERIGQILLRGPPASV